MANLDDELAAAMAGLGQEEVVEEFEEHDYELGNSQLTEAMEEEQPVASSICNDMNAASQMDAMEDLHDNYAYAPQPDNVAKYRDKDIVWCAKTYRAANEKLRTLMTAFLQNKPSTHIESLRKQVVDMPEDSEDDKRAKINAVADFNEVLSIRRKCRDNLQLRQWMVNLMETFKCVPDADEYEELKQTMADTKQAIIYKKAEKMKRFEDGLNADINAAMDGKPVKKAKTTDGASSSTNAYYPRPPGRAPANKEWDTTKGEWVANRGRR